ncbi:DnaJ domain-containing protein [Spirulina subsalsa FACHB-351]|uniref:DnaJ domain-containing protein n=1 Tax=Spirulina subsalsa FACHB-351 TaxID=234711 RepID=A0ABT3L5B8_9CYAN|nr:DnaJ domain-containing protein [Spirulina subsalsa]MCW6036688.1 DnaJ domain-containing protein [Spirulina subsalsa FACHB-351]
MPFNIQRGLFKLDITDHYAILGLPVTVESKAIRKRYLKIAQSLHPDTSKVANDQERQLASEILSKWVNPAYEMLKGKGRNEYQLVLSQTGKRLASEGGKINVDSEVAQKLLQASSNIDAAYQTIVQALAAKQYDEVGKIAEIVGQLSEVNLVYLLRKQGQGVREASASAPSGGSTPTTGGKPAPAATRSAPPPAPDRKTSPVDGCVRRAQEYIAKNNYSKAILELRDGLKLDPNSSSCHGLMGWAYLKQNQVSMAKVHIAKALQSNPNDPIAQKGQKALAQLGQKITPAQSSSSSSSSSSDSKGNKPKSGGGGMFGGLFGGKKK